jgi:hypothetical protein
MATVCSVDVLSSLVHLGIRSCNAADTRNPQVFELVFSSHSPLNAKRRVLYLRPLIGSTNKEFSRQPQPITKKQRAAFSRNHVYSITSPTPCLLGLCFKSCWYH